MGLYAGSPRGSYVAKIRADTGAVLWATTVRGASSSGTTVARELILDGTDRYLYGIGYTSAITGLGRETLYIKLDTAKGIIKGLKLQGCAYGDDMGESLAIDRLNTTIWAVSNQKCYYKGATQNQDIALVNMDLDLTSRWSKRLGTAQVDRVKQILANPWEEKLMIIGSTQSVIAPLFGYYDYHGDQIFLKTLGGTTDDDNVLFAQYSADGKSLFAIGSYLSSIFRPPSITTSVTYFAIIKINLVTQVVSAQVTLNNAYGIYGSIGHVLLIDKRNNLVAAGAFPNFASTPYADNLFLVKFQANMQDWACFYTTTNFNAQFVNMPFAWEVDDIPADYGTYSEDGSNLVTTVQDTSFTMTINNAQTITDYFSLCGGYHYLVSPSLTQYFYQYSKYRIMRLDYRYFYQCNPTSSMRLTNAQSTTQSYVGLETNTADKGDVLKDPSDMFLTGISLTEGVYSIIIKGQLSPPATTQVWTILTYRVLGENNPIQITNFFMDPDYVVIRKPYKYQFNVYSFFSSTDPIHQVIPLVKTIDPDTFEAIYSPLPPWLTFDDSTCSFSGTPLKADYPTQNQPFPITLSIALKVIDTYNLEAISNSFVFTIRNFPPYIDKSVFYKNETGLIWSLCLSLNTPFYVKIPRDAISDEDMQTLTYDLKTSNGVTLPQDGLEYDQEYNLLTGIPSVEKEYYGVVSASDQFYEATGDISWRVSKRPYLDHLKCQGLKEIEVELPITKALYISYQSCLKDDDSPLSFEMSLMGGANIPNCFSFGKYNAKLVVIPGEQCWGINNLIVRAYSLIRSCEFIDFSTQIILNTPVQVKPDAVNQLIAQVGTTFIHQLNATDYFSQPDLGDNISLQVAFLNPCPWLSFIPIHTYLIGTPFQTGACTLRLIGTDTFQSSDSLEITITIIDQKLAALNITKLLDFTVTGGETFEYKIDKNLSIDRQIVMSIMEMPGWLEFDGSTATLKSQLVPQVESESIENVWVDIWDMQQNYQRINVKLLIIPDRVTRALQTAIELRIVIIGYDFKQELEVELMDYINFTQSRIIILRSTFNPQNVSELVKLHENNFTLKSAQITNTIPYSLSLLLQDPYTNLTYLQHLSFNHKPTPHSTYIFPHTPLSLLYILIALSLTSLILSLAYSQLTLTNSLLRNGITLAGGRYRIKRQALGYVSTFIVEWEQEMREQEERERKEKERKMKESELQRERDNVRRVVVEGIVKIDV